MIILEGVMGEAEMRAMSDEQLILLKPLINRYIAECFDNYMQNPQADSACVQRIQKLFGDAITSILNNRKLEDPRIFEMIKQLSGYDLSALRTSSKLQEIQGYVKLIEEVVPTCKLSMPPRKSSDYNAFNNMYLSVLNSMSEYTEENMISRYMANRIILYRPNEKEINYRSSVLLKYKSSWYGVKQGMDYYDYCERNKVSDTERIML